MMRELDEQSLPDYLRQSALINRDEPARVTRLDGGVSNVVFYVERSPDAKARGTADFVLKQARGRLRVAQPWFCSVERIWREVAVLRAVEQVLRKNDGQAGRLPRVLYEDRENYLFTMTAAPRDSRTWKSDLLAGRFDVSIAAACGSLLGRIHARTWADAALAQSLGDRTFFCDLRVDPYYRRIAEVHADLRPAVDELIAALDQNRCCLVHGDFSPKNLLVWDEAPSPTAVVAHRLMLIDCEVGHYGDPAFDLGFFLTHLIAKGVHRRCAGHSSPSVDGQERQSDGENLALETFDLCRAFLKAYAHALNAAVSADEQAALERRAVQNLAGCLLARVDGKSPLEYLSLEAERDALRRMARRLFEARPETMAQGLTMAVDSIS